MPKIAQADIIHSSQKISQNLFYHRNAERPFNRPVPRSINLAALGDRDVLREVYEEQNFINKFALLFSIKKTEQTRIYCTNLPSYCTYLAPRHGGLCVACINAPQLCP